MITLLDLLVREWARYEFHRHRTLTDLAEIRTQLALGRRHLSYPCRWLLDLIIRVCFRL
jgi:hypothetical protein